MRGGLLALTAISLASPLAHADESLRPDQIPTRARELAERGRAFHDAGDYAHAIIAFKEAYVLAPSPGLLFNLAQAYRLAGQCEDAAWMYHRYLDTNPGAEARILAEAHLSTLEKCAHGGLHLGIQPTAYEIKIPDPAPPSAADDLGAKRDLVPGQREKQIGTWVVIGGGVALVGALYFAIDANDASNTVSDLYKKGGKWQDIAATDQRGHRSATLATVCAIGGLAAAATGGVLYALGRRHEQAQHVAVVPTAHGAEVSLTWGF
ncbi:MAG: Tetratricopeptide 4 [Myxococcales bacterium]|nr:Tetratricopeptide 4 [Myxococcales bacterium]